MHRVYCRPMKTITLSLLVALALTPTASAQQTAASQAAMTPAQALQRLKDGNARFLSGKTEKHDWSKQIKATASGQYPFAAVLACMDSRAPVEIVFDQGIGEMFVVRVAGNVVDDDDLGSLEYTAHSGSKLLVVMGHTSCGAVKGALEGVQLGNLTGLLGKIHPAMEAAHCSDAKSVQCVDDVTEQNVRNSMKEIRARSPYLAKDLDEGKLALVGAIYDVGTGKVRFLEDKP